jgi:hypothetical protein
VDRVGDHRVDRRADHQVDPAGDHPADPVVASQVSGVRKSGEPRVVTETEVARADPMKRRDPIHLEWRDSRSPRV